MSTEQEATNTPQVEPDAAPAVIDWEAKYKQLEAEHTQLKGDRSFLASAFSDVDPKEVEELRAYRTQTEAEREKQAQADLEAKYADLLDAPDEVMEEWVRLVENGADVEKAAAYVRHTHGLSQPQQSASASAPARESKPVRPGYLSGAESLDRGDSPVAREGRPVRRSMDEMILDSAAKAFR